MFFGMHIPHPDLENRQSRRMAVLSRLLFRPGKVSVHKRFSVILALVSALFAVAQTAPSTYQPGTITAVTTHQNEPGDAGESVARYDVSVKIGNVIYVVLYTPLNGSNTVEYSPGIEMLFSVGNDKLTFNSRISGSTQVPILRREVLPAKSGIDWSKAPSQYFAMKEQHLTEALGLSEDQQVRIKPTLEQEAGEAAAFLWDPMLSRKEKLKRYEKLVAESDAKIKANLLPTQVDKLQELRKQQKSELKKLVSKQSADKQD
ncbi:MAG: hypothetical protein WAL52_01020 [Candidatus Sulfotelmatobacter sp.]